MRYGPSSTPAVIAGTPSFVSEGIGGHKRVDRGTLGKRSGVGVRREQRFHFIPERSVLAARVAQKRRALVRRVRQRRVKDLLDPRPSAADRPS